MKTRDICIIGIVIIIIGLAVYRLFYTHTEGMTFNTFTIPRSGDIPYGYYRVDDKNMAKVPYGYEVDTTDKTYKKIIPLTNNSYFVAKPVPIPVSGIPMGFYQVSPGYMAHLPDNMYAKIKSVNFDGSFVYENGYVGETDYYSASFPIPNKAEVPTLPPNCFLNNDKNTISLLPYGKISNGINTPGYVDNLDLISANGVFDYQTTQYNDISGKFDTLFHEDADKLRKKQSAFPPAKPGASVIDRDGNLIILPRESVQGDLTFNSPKDYKYGAANYVPNYEDSVYLSRTTQLPIFAEFKSADIKNGFCKAFKNDPVSMDEKCRQLDANSCASTSCCVLFGGSSCVAGNENGPVDSSNYNDIFIRNKDFYYYQGKCYGNCYKSTALYSGVGDGGDNGEFDYNNANTSTSNGSMGNVPSKLDYGGRNGRAVMSELSRTNGTTPPFSSNDEEELAEEELEEDEEGEEELAEEDELAEEEELEEYEEDDMDDDGGIYDEIVDTVFDEEYDETAEEYDEEYDETAGEYDETTEEYDETAEE